VLQWLGFPIKTIVIPTGLLLNGLNTLFALIPYARAGLVDFRGGLPAALAALLLAPLGAFSMQFIPQQVLLFLFAIAVFIAGIRSFLNTMPNEFYEPIATGRQLLISTAVGGFAGFIGGLLGIGGGFIIAPILMEIGYTTKAAAGTTAFIVTFSSFSGFIGHATTNHIDPALAIITIVAVIIGSQIGAWFMLEIASPFWIKKLYGLVLLGVAMQLMYGVIN
jgi:uncharacterized membrane protein YfcA